MAKEMHTTSSKIEAAESRSFASASGMEELTGEKPLNNYMTTLMHLTKCYVGTGIFAMGRAFKHTGLLCGTIFLTIIAIMNLNCQHMLIRTASRIAQEEVEQEVKPSFAETVEYTMEASTWTFFRKHSKKFNWITNIFLCFCELGFCSVYFVFISDHLVEIAETNHWLEKSPSNVHLVLVIILFPMWASTFLGNLKLLLPLSIIANVLMWTGIAIVIFYASQGLPPLSERRMINDVAGWPLFFGMTLFAFEGITFVIPLRNEMKNTNQFSSLFGVLNVGTTFVVTLFFIVGFLGYWKYGDAVRESIFLNLVQEDENMANIINSIMSVAVLFTFTLHMYIPFEITFPLFYRKYGPFKHGFLVILIYKSVPVLITYTFANIIPFLDLFISLIGSTAGTTLALIFPPVLELVALHSQLSIISYAKNVLIIVFGIFGAIAGTTVTIYKIAQEFSKQYEEP